MPYVSNQGVRIHYELEGQGPPLVLQYGQYCPLEIWYEYNYVMNLKNDYQLILVDARGHGLSDKPEDTVAYRIELMVSDIIAILDDLSLEKAHYMGYSSGGRVGFGLAKFAPERLYSLIIGGIHPYNDGPDSAEFIRNQIQSLEKQTAEDFVTGLEEVLLSINFPAFSSRLRSSMLNHNPRALIAWWQQFAQWPSFETILGKITVPCLLYSGENDDCYVSAQRAAEEIPDASFVSIPGGGHLEGGTWVNILLPYIKTVTAKAAPA